MSDQEPQEPPPHPRHREPINNRRTQRRKPQAGPIHPQPRPRAQRILGRTPPRHHVSPGGDLGPKIDEYSDGEVLPSEAILDPRERGDGVLGLEDYFSDKADGEQDLDVVQLADGQDVLIDRHGVEFGFVENFVVL
jgi:hypothetical protein